MTKEPNKDFRETVAESVAMWMNWPPKNPSAYALADRILALCKEMLVPEVRQTNYPEAYIREAYATGWNACRSELLKQLGE